MSLLISQYENGETGRRRLESIVAPPEEFDYLMERWQYDRRKRLNARLIRAAGSVVQRFTSRPVINVGCEATILGDKRRDEVIKIFAGSTNPHEDMQTLIDDYELSKEYCGDLVLPTRTSVERIFGRDRLVQRQRWLHGAVNILEVVQDELPAPEDLGGQAGEDWERYMTSIEDMYERTGSYPDTGGMMSKCGLVLHEGRLKIIDTSLGRDLESTLRGGLQKTQQPNTSSIEPAIELS